MKDIFWLEPANGLLAEQLAIVLRPRGGDWLESELSRMKRAGVQTLVSMLEQWEAAGLELTNEGTSAERIGLTFLSYPIPDRTTPSKIKDFELFAMGLADRVRSGERIGIHCRGCIGRATIALACTLIHMGWEPKAALAAIEKTRGCEVPDTEEQRTWILQYGRRQ